MSHSNRDYNRSIRLSTTDKGIFYIFFVLRKETVNRKRKVRFHQNRKYSFLCIKHILSKILIGNTIRLKRYSFIYYASTEKWPRVSFKHRDESTKMIVSTFLLLRVLIDTQFSRINAEYLPFEAKWPWSRV